MSDPVTVLAVQELPRERLERVKVEDLGPGDVVVIEAEEEMRHGVLRTVLRLEDGRGGMQAVVEALTPWADESAVPDRRLLWRVRPA